MYQWCRLRHVEKSGGTFFILVAQYKIVQLRLSLLDQSCHGDGGVNICQCIMGHAVLNTIGGCQMFKPHAGLAVFKCRPLDSFRAQCAGQSQQVDNVPTGVAVLPFALIRIVEVALECVTGHLVVESQGVITNSTGSRVA